ncbi:hypothetical protein JCM8097_007505 [Rhodosporidiobolus ruineniae]
MQSPSRALDAVAEEEEDTHSHSHSHSHSVSSSARPSQQHAHARQHSRIHERNLSAFFPRPGEQGIGYGTTFDDPHARQPFEAGVADIPSPTAPRVAGADAYVDAATPTRSSSAAGRRGHHHRHSVSHSIFPFLDSPEQQRAATSPIKPLHPGPSAAAQLPAATASFRQRHGHRTLFFQTLAFAAFYLPPAARGLVLVSLAQIAVGAVLWVQGQAGESLATTGLGYLVVFDGIGGLSSVILERPSSSGESVWDVVGSSKDASIRQPYGSYRLVTLSHFSQAVYLLFSAVYVCKESVEHVLLLHDPQDTDGAHGSGHGGAGHGEGRALPAEVHDGSIALPHLALLASAFLAAFLAFAARNHQGLSQSLQTPLLSRDRDSRSPPSSVLRVLNPFTLTLVLFATALLGMGAVLPSTQLPPVDKVLALLESTALFYIASPAAAATGQILLQTSPPPQALEVQALESALSRLEALPCVYGVDQRHVWQHGTSASASSASSVGGEPPRLAVVTLTILAKHDAADGDLLEATRLAHEYVGAASTARKGRGRPFEVDLTVAAKRV